jgi:hypothetical protein
MERVRGNTAKRTIKYARFESPQAVLVCAGRLSFLLHGLNTSTCRDNLALHFLIKNTLL